MAQRKGLGRGLDSMIPDKIGKQKNANNTNENATGDGTAGNKQEIKEKNNKIENAVDGAIYLDINKVEPNRNQPRKSFDEEGLQELADSMQQYGIIQPLVVQQREDYYEIIAGERRWRAAKIAGLKEVPVIIKTLSEQEIMEISLIENIQRENLNPIEEANAYKRLLEEFQLKQEEVAQRVAKSRTAITNSLRLLKLDTRVQELLASEAISAGHARALISIEDGDTQYNIAKRIVEEKLSVRDVEKLVKKLTGKKEQKEGNPEKISKEMAAIYQNLEEQLKVALGTRVSIKYKDAQKGKLEIEYYSQDELDRIIELIKSGEH